MKNFGNIKNKIMKNVVGKRFGMAVLAVVLVASIPMSAYATGSLGRAAEIKSTGNIEVKEGDETKVAIYSSDFTYLANEIDNLEKTAKWENIQALLQIGTDLGIENENSVAAVTFKEINDAIRNSQKISGTYTTKEGPEDLVGATAENLSLGTAAWVDGQYIVGNGADNNSYYYQGQDDMANGAVFFKQGTSADFTDIITDLGKQVSDFTGNNFKAVFNTGKMGSMTISVNNASGSTSGTFSGTGSNNINLTYSNGIVKASVGNCTAGASGPSGPSTGATYTPSAVFGIIFDPSDPPFAG